MNDILMVNIYVDTNGTMIFVSCKKTVPGYRLVTEPYRTYEAGEVNSVPVHIRDMMSEIAVDPVIEDVSKAPDVMKEVCGKKSFAQFSKEHINIGVCYDVQEKTYSISNSPRLSDGSYGVRKNTISEQYSSKFVCSCDDDDQIRENFLKACAEAQNYLYAIGASKEPAIDYEFGRKVTWIAIKGASTELVLQNERIVNLERVVWGKGLGAVESDNKKVFIAGPCGGWVVIVGKNLPDPTRPQTVVRLLKELSGGSREVYYFSAHRTVGVYGFAHVVAGEVERMYGYSGETGHVCANVGPKSRAEQELGLNLAEDDEVLFEEGKDEVCEEDVFKIASMWCIRPGDFLEARERDCYVAEFLPMEEELG